MKTNYKAVEKAKIVLEVLKGDTTISEIASKHNVHPTVVSRWKTQAIENLPLVFENETSKMRQQAKEYEREKEELYRQIGKLSTEKEWLKKKSNIEL